MKFELLSRAALATDIPEYQLKAGDLVTIVECLPANQFHGHGYVVEVFDVLGNTLHVIALDEAQLQELKPKAIPPMREPIAA
jgi:hypothetical protein